MIKRYVPKKPLAHEAMQYDGTYESEQQVLRWLDHLVRIEYNIDTNGLGLVMRNSGLFIPVDPGSWIRLVSGEIVMVYTDENFSELFEEQK